MGLPDKHKFPGTGKEEIMVRTQRASLLTIVTLVALVSIAQAQSLPCLTHHVRQVVLDGQAKPVGQLPANQTMSLDVVLALRDQAGLDAFLQQLYDPTSPVYRHFLTPTEFTERFGPSQENYGALVRLLNAAGFTITGGNLDRRDVQIKGPVLAVQSTFHITMGTYLDPASGRIFYSPDREPTVDLPFALWHISGFDNYSIPHPLFVKKPEGYVTSHATTGSGPSASFLGSDMRAAYYGGTTLTGAGQNLGLFEHEGMDLTDLNTYYKNVGQTNNVPITLLSTDGTSTSCVSPSCDDTEQTLDMTQALGMAPALASLVVYVGATDTAIISMMTTHEPLPTTIGCSWGWTPADPSTLDPYFQQMSTQGQNFFAASGDASTWSKSNEAWPADDAYIVSVGGTDLVTSSAAGPWQSETAWSNSGGGISPDSIAIPSWQQLSGVINSSNRGSTTLRNGPDVSANANYSFYVCADQKACTANSYGGTSFAAPMWAGYIALLNEQLNDNGQASIGFINPAIYAENLTSSYATDFHDITSGTSGSYSAVKGYDLVTGWGSPNGAGLINTLFAANYPTFTLSASPTSVSVTQGGSGTSTITTSISGGFNAPISLSPGGLPTGVTVSFNPTTIAAPGTGTSTMTINVGSSTAPGTYTIMVEGSGQGFGANTNVSLTVTAGSTPSFTISASPSSVTVNQGSSGTSTITTSVSGGFNSSISLSASGMPSGVTASFNPSSIAAPGSGSSTLTLSVSSSASAGTYSITITGTGGGLTETTSVSLTVNSGGGNPSFSLSASPGSITVAIGSSGNSTITSSISGGFSSSISFIASGMPFGVSASFSPSSIPAPGSGSTTMTLSANSNASPGTYSITIFGDGGGQTQTTSVSLTLSTGGNPSFSLSANPNSISVTAGSSGTSTITSSIAGGFSSAVSLTASGMPAGVSAGFNPSTIAAPGSGSSTLTLSTSSGTAASTYTITIIGGGGGQTQTTSVSLTVGSGGTPTLGVSANPASVTAVQGSSGTSTITTSIGGGFSSSVSLTASGMPSGVTATFSPSSIGAPGSGTSTLTLAASSSAPAGTYPITVLASGGGLTATTSVSLTVSTSGGGGELITDGCLASATKSGLSAPGWTATTNKSHNIIFYHGNYPDVACGHNYADLGDGYNNVNDTLTQTISIPAGSTVTPLTFDVNITTSETGTTATDFLYVEIHNTSGTLLGTVLTMSNLGAAHDNNKKGAYYHVPSVDLSAYAGQTVELVFHATTNSTLPTTFLIDNVAVNSN